VSFGEHVRQELAAPPVRTCCRAAFLSALVHTAGVLQLRGGGGIAVEADLGEAAAARAAFSLLRELGAPTELRVYRERRLDRRQRVVVRIEGDRGLQVLHEIGVLSSRLAPLVAPPRRVVARRCCRRAYLRGAFLAAGSVAAPRRPAHLEVRTGDPEGAAAIAALAREDDVALDVTARRGHAIAYTKRAETVRELLAHIGAHDAVLALSEGDVMARTRERANRLTNCDRANLARTSAAAHRQRAAIAALDLDRLEPPLREVAELRLRHPDASLTELAERAALSRSAVARRMRVLMALTNP
jgi:cell division protein WhiA